VNSFAVARTTDSASFARPTRSSALRASSPGPPGADSPGDDLSPSARATFAASSPDSYGPAGSCMLCERSKTSATTGRLSIS